jgi:hypothetical protein
MPFMAKKSKYRINIMNGVPTKSSPGLTSLGTRKCSKIWWNKQMLSVLSKSSTNAAPRNWVWEGFMVYGLGCGCGVGEPWEAARETECHVRGRALGGRCVGLVSTRGGKNEHILSNRGATRTDPVLRPLFLMMYHTIVPTTSRMYRMLLGDAQTSAFSGPSHPGSSTRSFPELSFFPKGFLAPASSSAAMMTRARGGGGARPCPRKRTPCASTWSVHN